MLPPYEVVRASLFFVSGNTHPRMPVPAWSVAAFVVSSAFAAGRLLRACPIGPMLAAVVIITAFMPGDARAQEAVPASGELVVVPQLLDVGQTTLAVGFQVQPDDLEVRLEYSAHFTPEGESCQAASAGATQSSVASISISLTACSAGDTTVRLVAADTGVVIEEVDVTITEPAAEAPAGASAAAAPSVSLSGVTSSLNVGQSDKFTVSASGLDRTIDYELHTVPLNHSLAFNSGCNDRRKTADLDGVTSYSTSYSAYACRSPGSVLWAYLDDHNGNSVASSGINHNRIAVRPTVSLGLSSYSLKEGKNTTVTVSLNGSNGQRPSVSVSFSRGTAESGDYSVSGLSGNKLVFGFGDTSKSFTITANEDSDCDNETLTISISPPSGVAKGSPYEASLTITDNDDSSLPPCKPTSTNPTPTPTPMVKPETLCERYDTDDDGEISKDELAEAIEDYFNDIITRPDLNEVIACYCLHNPPSQVQSLEAVAVTGGVKASWRAPSTCAATEYRVQRRLSSDSWPRETDADKETGLTRTFSRLSSGTYDVRVKACKSTRCGPWTEKTGVIVTGVTQPPPTPQPPTPPTSNTNNPPTITGLASVTHQENITTVATYTATGGTAISWTVSGTDKDAFEIPGGVLMFKAIKPPDFENPSDAGADNVYNVTVVATNRGSPSKSAQKSVTITVTNVEERGSLRLEVDGSALSAGASVEVGTSITAILSDPDGGESSLVWLWQSSTDGDDPWNDVSGPTNSSSTEATYSPVRDDAGRTLRASVSYADGHGPGKTSNSVAVTVRLVKPTLDLTPLPLRKAKVSWAGIDNANEYVLEIQEPGGTWNSPKKVTVTAPSFEIALDNILQGKGLANSPYSYEFRVKARNRSSIDIVSESDFSDTISIIDNPILTGGRANGHSPDGKGRITLNWQRISTATQYRIEYRRLGILPPGTEYHHTNVNWPSHPRFDWPYYLEQSDSPALFPKPESGVAPETITGVQLQGSNPQKGLQTGEIYAVQLNYQTDTGMVYSARDAYVWLSDGLPGHAQRVATYPFFGHHEEKHYKYVICDDSFPSNDWVTIIENAFETWQTATNDFVMVTHETAKDCDDTFTILSQLIMDNDDINEVKMFDPSNVDLFPEVFTDAFKFCIYFAPACVTSYRGYNSILRSPTRVLESVDVSFNKDKLTDTYIVPDRVDFNTCKQVVGVPGSLAAFELAVHEAGHALGMSQFSFDLLESLTETRRIRQAHPTIPDSVMNYDNSSGEIAYRLPANFNEPDCSPHPFDVMAIFALYQSN